MGFAFENFKQVLKISRRGRIIDAERFGGSENMEEKKQYRNAIRSKQMIRQAYMDLLREKPYEKITATDIIQRADINRSTFYAHYPDARGILDEIVAEITQMFQTVLSAMDFGDFFRDPRPIMQQVIAFLQRNMDLYQMLLRSSMALEQAEQLKKVLIQQAMESPNLPVADRNSPQTQIRVRILLSGLVDGCRQWLEGAFNCTLEEAADEVASIVRIMGMELQIKE